jgi:hypothetical protein
MYKMLDLRMFAKMAETKLFLFFELAVENLQSSYHMLDQSNKNLYPYEIN